MVVGLVMACRLLRELRQASTHLDTLPVSNRRHPFSGIAPNVTTNSLPAIFPALRSSFGDIAGERHARELDALDYGFRDRTHCC